MTGTYINQQQFDDINACMDYMKTPDVSAWQFTQLLGLVPQWPAFIPSAEIKEAARQSSSWNIKSNADYYLNVATLLAEVISLTDYVVTFAASLTPANRRRGVDVLEQMLPPPGLKPMYATKPLTDGLQLLKHYQQLMWAKAQIGELAATSYGNLRQGIYTTLPRVADFMSFYLRRAIMLGGHGPASDTARQLAQNVDRLYVFGMSGMANYMTQTQRITEVIANASDRLNALERRTSMRVVVNDMKLIKRDLTDAQRYCEEMAALGTRP